MSESSNVSAKNASFFNDNDRYLQSVSSLETYLNIRRELETSLRGSSRLLDIGNGGVFDYPLDVANEIVGVDLFVGEAASARLPDHVKLLKADARALPDDIGRFDTVTMIMLVHHLVGPRVDDQDALIREMLNGLDKVLDVGGRLVIVESTVSEWFYQVERRLYPLAHRVLTSRQSGHPPVMQLTTDRLAALVGERFVVTRVAPIPVGRWLLQFGRRFPAALTPARPVVIEAHRP